MERGGSESSPADCFPAERARMVVPDAFATVARTNGAPMAHLGIDEQTLEIRAVEVTGSDVGDAPMLPELLSQTPLIRTSPASPPTLPTTRARATTPLQIAGWPPSFHPARTPSRERLKRQVLLRATRPCGHRNTSAARSGDDGADTTVEAA